MCTDSARRLETSEKFFDTHIWCGVDTGEIDPIKVDESLNAADMHTKYLVFNVWRRHLWHAHNLTTERCAKARARMQAALAEFKQE